MAAINEAEKISYLLVRFTYGDSSSYSYKAYTDWTANIPGSPTFVSTPEMEVEETENTGHVGKEKTANIAIPYIRNGTVIDTFIQELISGIAHSPVYVEIWEITKDAEGETAGTQRFLFRGRVIQTTKNFRGNPEKSLINCASIKSRLNVPLGLPAEHHCTWGLYHPTTCKLSLSGKTHLYTIAEVDGKVIRTSTTPAQSGSYFFRGWVEYGGLSIDIQQWDGDGTEPDLFYLTRQAPSSWVGKNVTFFKGCKRTIEACRADHNNEANFGGMGYGMLAYDPLIENPV